MGAEKIEKEKRRIKVNKEKHGEYKSKGSIKVTHTQLMHSLDSEGLVT